MYIITTTNTRLQGDITYILVGHHTFAFPSICHPLRCLQRDKNKIISLFFLHSRFFFWYFFSTLLLFSFNIALFRLWTGFIISSFFFLGWDNEYYDTLLQNVMFIFIISLSFVSGSVIKWKDTRYIFMSHSILSFLSNSWSFRCLLHWYITCQNYHTCLTLYIRISDIGMWICFSFL